MKGFTLDAVDIYLSTDVLRRREVKVSKNRQIIIMTSYARAGTFARQSITGAM
jgi:hypothetical protein